MISFASSELTIKQMTWYMVTVHSNDIPHPVKLSLKQHSFDAGGVGASRISRLVMLQPGCDGSYTIFKTLKNFLVLCLHSTGFLLPFLAAICLASFAVLNALYFGDI